MSQITGYHAAAPGTQPDFLHATYVSTRLRAPQQPRVVPVTVSALFDPAHALGSARNFIDRASAEAAQRDPGA